jgi:anti-anti-sigma factor
MIELTSDEKDGQAIIHLPDQLSQNDWLDFRDQVNRQFIDRGIHHVIIDCERNADMPSIAFGSLTCLSRDFRRINGSLYLVHVSERNRRVLTRTRMDQILPIYGTLTEAFRNPNSSKRAIS